LSGDEGGLRGAPGGRSYIFLPSRGNALFEREGTTLFAPPRPISFTCRLARGEIAMSPSRTANSTRSAFRHAAEAALLRQRGAVMPVLQGSGRGASV